ncbi:MAG TPA: family 16 glycoside hydrolase, partial [Fimbriiglobus sp.]|nr:family 16 glycoside hydrolase [Fimbriiglobus sp.]
RKGYLALESEGAECHFRNIKIKELPSTNPKPDQVAKVDEGFKSLFTGLDLAGWKTEPDAWKAAGGHLRAAGKADLVSEKTFDRFELVFDCKMPAKSKGKWFVEFGTNQLQSIGNADASGRGKWNRVVVTVGPGEVSWSVNGRPIGKVDPGVAAGPIRFKPAEGLELMNVFVRELKEK